ncbi:MAG: hypothetical protein AAGJ93_10420 [Bacteroidota bacterium]
MLILYTSCEDVEVEFDCGEVETEITELSHRVGTYTAATFTNNNSTNFEEAAIIINIDDFIITTETETSCFAFTPIPQLLEMISITSSGNVTTDGLDFASSEELSELFKLHNKEQTYSITEFITAQNDDPTLFHSGGDEIILQLLNQPDVAINQSFEIQFIFDDSEISNVAVSNFEVSN